MTTRVVLRRLVPAVLLAVLVGACGPFGGNEDDGAEKAAEAFAAALARGDVSGIAFTDPGAAAAHAALTKPLGATVSTVSVVGVKGDGTTRTATLAWSTEIGASSGQAGVAPWVRETSVSLVDQSGSWKVAWQPTVVDASLVDGEALVVTGIKATRGDVLGAGGATLVEPRPVVRFGIDKSLMDPSAAGSSATRLASLLDVDLASYVSQVEKAGPRAFVQALVLRRGDVPNRLLAQVQTIPGGRSISDRLPLAPTKDFAAALLGTVGPATAELIKKSDGRLRAGDDTGLSGLQLRYDEQLSGTSGATVSAVRGESRRVLFTAAPVAGKDLRTTLDQRLQSKAQQLLTRYGPASALVAVRPSTGEMLVAASGPGSDGYNTATFGQYAPGSTFKVVSALALLRSGLTADSRVYCPPTVVVNGKRFKNYSDYPSDRLGRITLRQAVANSCNTAFISSRAKITGTALADAAAALGFGIDHDSGFPAYFGQVPTPAGETEAAADLIGQGKVLASPMVMAAVMASVVSGKTVVPDLVLGDAPVTATPAEPLTEDEATQLRTLLHAVVEEGSGRFLQALGRPGVLAKTGTAEYGDASRTHTWMIGAQGDLAVAVFVETGESGSRTAGPVLADFLRFAR
ncbi:MAG: penicillin-binding transpeptidase domain-containing protein [Propionibacteriales bacterium]|nr:penicillin-binding transpeptidase domain-containing protein [Propionibacteriales bacterium]